MTTAVYLPDMPKGYRLLSDQIREAVNASGRTHKEIAGAAGIDKSQMSRFMTGERGLTITALDALAKVLGLELRKARRKGAR